MEGITQHLQQMRDMKANYIKKESILSEAERIVNGERQIDYDNPVSNFKNIAALASLLIGKELTPADCCKILMVVKLIREKHRHKRDNLVDLCGYTEILNRINDDT
jgi:hypothetical protein